MNTSYISHIFTPTSDPRAYVHDLFQKGWVTINGNHVFIDDDGNTHGRHSENSHKGGLGADKTADKNNIKDEEFDKLTNEHRKSYMSDKQVTALRDYQMSSSLVNGYLREGPEAIKDGADRTRASSMVTSLDKSMAGMPLKNSLTSYRLTNFANDTSIGSIISDKGYMSTSLSANIAEKFSREVGEGKESIIAITMPKGTVGVFPTIYTGDLHSEHEFLLQRGSSLQITGHSHILVGGNAYPLIKANLIQ